MRSTFLALVAVALCVTAVGVRAQQQFQLYASIVDATGTPPAQLQPTDVRVMENGQEGKVVKIETVTWPVKLQLLVDNGIGLGQENLIHLRNGVRALLEALPEGIEVTFVTTAPQPRFLVRATTNKEELLKGIDRLAFDGGAGRFLDSLNEATQRIEKDKTDFLPMIITAATTSGDTNVLERDVERMMKRLQARPTKVHMVLLSGGSRSASGGANQTQIGKAVTDFTRGRYENIAAPSRLATLLPELGADVAKVHQQQSKQFKLTVERPSGASGDLGKISAGARGSLNLTGISLNAPMP